MAEALRFIWRYRHAIPFAATLREERRRAARSRFAASAAIFFTYGGREGRGNIWRQLRAARYRVRHIMKDAQRYA